MSIYNAIQTKVDDLMDVLDAAGVPLSDICELQAVIDELLERTTGE